MADVTTVVKCEAFIGAGEKCQEPATNIYAMERGYRGGFHKQKWFVCDSCGTAPWMRDGRLVLLSKVQELVEAVAE